MSATVFHAGQAQGLSKMLMHAEYYGTDISKIICLGEEAAMEHPHHF